MVIDFHTHVFPAKIAGKAVAALERSSGYESFSDGTIKGLIASMDESGIDYSVNQPILTKPESFYKTLDRLKEQTDENGRVLSFAAIHPLSEDVEKCVATIKELGFKGIKLHPFFQNEPINSARTKKLVALASEAGLFTMIHPGKDASFPGASMASPEMIIDLLDDVRPKNVILAHMGGMEEWNSVLDLIVGRDVYFDTSFSLDVMGEELFVKTVRAHGADRVLFGTDSPWRSQKDYVRRLKACRGLTEEEKRLVFYKNAAKILNIKV